MFHVLSISYCSATPFLSLKHFHSCHSTNNSSIGGVGVLGLEVWGLGMLGVWGLGCGVWRLEGWVLGVWRLEFGRLGALGWEGLAFGVWAFGRLGVWGFGRLVVLAFGRLGVWAFGIGRWVSHSINLKLVWSLGLPLSLSFPRTTWSFSQSGRRLCGFVVWDWMWDEGEG